MIIWTNDAQPDGTRLIIEIKGSGLTLTRDGYPPLQLCQYELNALRRLLAAWDGI